MTVRFGQVYRERQEAYWSSRQPSASNVQSEGGRLSSSSQKQAGTRHRVEPMKETRPHRLFQVSVILMLVGLVSLSVLMVLFYGINVHLNNHMNQVIQDTRRLTEANKTLQVHLNHLKSYQFVEAASAQMPNLKPAHSVIQIPKAPVSSVTQAAPLLIRVHSQPGGY